MHLAQKKETLKINHEGRMSFGLPPPKKDKMKGDPRGSPSSRSNSGSPGATRLQQRSSRSPKAPSPNTTLFVTRRSVSNTPKGLGE